MNTNDYLVKLVDYGFTTTVDKLWSDSADHAGPNWVSRATTSGFYWRIPFLSQVLKNNGYFRRFAASHYNLPTPLQRTSIVN